MLHCPKCGTNNTQETKFCTNCGQKIGEEVFKQENLLFNETARVKQKKKKSNFLKIAGKIFLGIVVLFAVAVILLLAFDDGKKESIINKKPKIDSNDTKTIETNQGFSAATIGDLNANGIKLIIPKNTFDKEVQLQVNTFGNTPNINTKLANILGTVYTISINQKSKRLNRPVTIALKLKENDISNSDYPKDLQIGYFADKQWNFIKSKEINLEKKFITFETFHFSDYTIINPKKRKLLDDFAQEKAVEQWSKNSNSKPIKKAVSQILLSKLGITDKSMTQDIVESIMNEGDFNKLMVSYNDNNMTQFNQDLAILAGKKIVTTLKNYESTGNLALKGLTDHASKVGTGVNMLLALSNGDYKKAAEELSNEIINSYPITKLFREGVKVIGNEINRWRDKGVNNAYEVYTKGVDKYGYDSVEKGDFEEIWKQMKGVSRQLLIEAKKRYAKKENKKWGELSKKEIDDIEEKVKKDLKVKFIKRQKEEKEIARLKNNNWKLIEVFDKGGLLKKGKLGYPEYSSLELRLHRLFKITQKVLKDTHSKIGYSTDKKLGLMSRSDIKGLIRMWYSKPKGKERYRKELIKLGYIKIIKQKPSTNLDSRLFGKWVFRDAIGTEDIRIFKSDGTLISETYNIKRDWKWKVENNKLVLSVTGGTPAIQAYKIEGNKLYFYVEGPGVWSSPFIKK